VATLTAAERALQQWLDSHVASGIPVAVEGIVASAGLALRRDDASARGHGALLELGGVWTIMLPGQGGVDTMSPRERFTAMHELAHFIVEKETSFRPGRRRDYWELEKLCDAFAGRMLIPDSLLGAFFSLTDPTKALVLTMQLARKGIVSFEVAARAVARTKTGFAFVSLNEQTDSRKTHRGTVTWSTESEVLGLAAHAYVNVGHPLAAAVAAHATSFVGERRTVAIDELGVIAVQRISRRQLVCCFLSAIVP